jgi:hypothetical protein
MINFMITKVCEISNEREYVTKIFPSVDISEESISILIEMFEENHQNKM